MNRGPFPVSLLVVLRWVTFIIPDNCEYIMNKKERAWFFENIYENGDELLTIFFSYDTIFI